MKVIQFIKKKGKSVYDAKIRITNYDIEIFSDLGFGEYEGLPSAYNKWFRRQYRELQRLRTHS